MIRFEREVLIGLMQKGGMLGAPAMLIAYYFGQWSGALGVLVGEFVMLVNIMGIAWLLGRALTDDPEKKRSSGGLTALFLLKLLVLFGLSYYVLAVVGLSPLGFVSGCMLGLGVLSWQVVSTTPTNRPDSDEKDETPSNTNAEL